MLGTRAEVVGELKPSRVSNEMGQSHGFKRLPIITGQSKRQEDDASYPGSPRRLQVPPEIAAVEPWELFDSDRVPSYM